jgi:hypothetical protein
MEICNRRIDLTQPTGVSTFAIRTSQRTDQKLQKSFHLCHPKENYFLKSLHSKIFKTTNTQAKQTENKINKMTAKAYIYNDLTMTVDRRPAYNRRLAQWQVKWLIEHSSSHQHLWCIDSFVLRNPPLRQAPKRQTV